MSVQKSDIAVRESDRINIEHEYELCVWARHFNASESHVKEAVAAVGDRAVHVREHLRTRQSERPSA